MGSVPAASSLPSLQHLKTGMSLSPGIPWGYGNWCSGGNGHPVAGISPAGLIWARRAVLTLCPFLVFQNRQVPDCPNAKDRLHCNTSGRGVGCVCVPVCIYLGASSGARTCGGHGRTRGLERLSSASPRGRCEGRTRGAIMVVASTGSAPPWPSPSP